MDKVGLNKKQVKALYCDMANYGCFYKYGWGHNGNVICVNKGSGHKYKFELNKKAIWVVL